MEKEPKPLDEKMGPVYFILLTLLTPSISPGDTIEIEVFFSGHGEPAKNKLRIQYPNKLINIDSVGSIQSSIGLLTDREGNKRPISGEAYFDHLEKEGIPLSHPLKEGSLVMVINDAFFLPHPKHIDPNYPGYIGLSSNEVPSIVSEYYYDGYPPILLKINTDGNTSPGNYEINMIFTYGDGVNMKITEKSVSVHLKGVLERYAFIITIASLVLALPILKRIDAFITNLIINIFKRLTAFKIT